MPTSTKTVYLMRGLPACGKSFTARRLVGETGVVCETDEFFYTQVGDDPACYDYDPDLLPIARQWNFDRFRKAVDASITPVVVDRGNGRNQETHDYARYAVDCGYHVELREPESPWWQEIRKLLEDKRGARTLSFQWAERLAEMSRFTHRVPVSVILDWMDGWRSDLTVQDILNLSTRDPISNATAVVMLTPQ